MSTIYILELESNKYYVGHNDLDAQIKARNIWTSTYKPLKIVSAIYTNYNICIDDIVKDCMFKYGIDHVRGGSYNTINTDTYDQLCNEIFGTAYNNNNNDLIMNDSQLEDSDSSSSYDDGYDSF